MTDPKHTPSPWMVHHMNMAPKDWALLGRCEVTVVCHGARVVAAVWGDDDEQEQANARLIEAAPDLLAALKRAEVVCEDAYHDAKAAYEKDNAAAALEAWEMVKSAIAKAEGRAND